MTGYLEYFTEIKSIEADYSNFKDFKIRCYFDNDGDELINYKGKNGLVSLEVYRELVKSLKGMGYNAIDIAEQLGRPEFYLWDSYKEYWDYKGDIDHINKIIDLVHEEGLLVQVAMYLGWAFNPLNEKHECWYEHKQSWIDRWISYMEGPLGKGDIFLLRPRSPIYDCKYRCNCERCVKAGTGKIMTAVFNTLEEIILSYKPNATLICDLYAEGVELFKNKTFQVSEKWILLYADNGFGKFIHNDTFSTGNNKKGIYLHSGFWLNHTVADPHLTPLYESIKKAYKLDLTDYILVNGQTFKNFILNLEAVMSMCHDINTYDKETFIISWLKRVLNIDDFDIANRIIHFINNFEEFHIKMSVRKSYLSPEDDVDRGFVANSINVLYPLIYELNKKTDASYKLVDEEFSIRKKNVLWTRKQSKSLLDECKFILRNIKEIEKMIENKSSRNAFNDQFTFGVELLTMQLQLISYLFDAIEGTIKKDYVISYHQKLYDFAEGGSNLLKFTSWHAPKNSRMHHPIPKTDIYI